MIISDTKNSYETFIKMLNAAKSVLHPLIKNTERKK